MHYYEIGMGFLFVCVFHRMVSILSSALFIVVFFGIFPALTNTVI